MTGLTPGRTAPVDPHSIAYRVHAHAFNTLTEWLARDDRFVPLSVRDNIATAVVGAIEPLIREDERQRALAAQERPAPGGLVRQMTALADDFDRTADQCRNSMPVHDAASADAMRKAARASVYRACAVAVRHGLRASGQEPQPAPELTEAMRESRTMLGYLDDFTHAVLDYAGTPAKIRSAAKSVRKKAGLPPVTEGKRP